MFAMFNRNSAPQLSPAEAVQKSAAGEIVLIDIRDGMELQYGGKAKGAVHVPMAVLAMKADPRSPECLEVFKSGKPIAVYCASGARSAMAKRMLAKMGHDDVHNIGGLGHWQMAGGEIER